jgi:hypothetical protein
VSSRVSRLTEAWRLLSLDFTTPFLDEMWVPRPPIPGFQEVLREGLSGMLTSPYSYAHPHYKTGKLYSAAFGHQAWAGLLTWAEQMYVFGGGDRSAEFLWRMIIFEIANRHLNAVSRELADLVQQFCTRNREYSEVRETRLAPQPQTVWDSNVFGGERSHVPADIISNICSSNLFLKTWNDVIWPTASEEDLAHLYELAIPIAVQHYIEPTVLEFPGTWITDLNPLFRRFL